MAISGDERRRIAIVGAGVAGLTCARILVQHGLSVTVFDKGQRPGGRISTRTREKFCFDHGAQYFTARDRRFEGQLERWLADGVAARWTPRLAEIGEAGTRWKTYSHDRWVGVPTMSALATSLASGLDVHSDTMVARAEMSGDGWSLVNDDGDRLGEYDGVVLALPPSQANALLHTAPALAKWTSSFVMEPCWAVLAAFASPLAVDLDGAFINHSPLTWIARNASKPGRPSNECWVLHASPNWSRENLELERKQVLDTLLAALFPCLRVEPVTPVYTDAHLWRYAMAALPFTDGFVYDEDLNLGVCGDWCCGSRIEGAYLSGLMLGERMASSESG